MTSDRADQFDSRPATLFHSQRVGELMVQVVKETLDRSTCHDRSKTEPPEVEVFDEFTPKLKNSTYGSAEYKGFLEAMGDGLKHHYANNRHHPEHFANGVNDMTLVDLIEMLADWRPLRSATTTETLPKALRSSVSASVYLTSSWRSSGTRPNTLGGSMCGADVEPQAQEATAHLLRDLVQSLADQEQVDVRSVRIGPVDFGSPDDHRPTA